MVSRQDLTVTLKNDVEEIVALPRELSSFFMAREIPRHVQLDVQLCLEEILINTISYGFPDGDEHWIKVGLALRNETLKVEVTDDGIPFNPLTASNVDIHVPMEERKVGGLGIHLIRSLMDRVEYTRTKGMNVLVLIKKVTS